MKEILKLGVILTVICAVAAFALGFTNQMTSGAIADQAALSSTNMRKELLADANKFEEIKEDFNAPLVREVYKGLKDGQVVGYTIKTAPSGYGGEVEVMVGISTEGNITAVSIGNHTETPGLGAIAKDDSFNDQYDGKSVSKNLEVIKNGTPQDNQIVAISGATITSDAVTTGVNAAIELYNNSLSK